MGIIPARAGFTTSRATARAPGADHPRSRGVYARAKLTATEFDGSSPLARGLQALTGWGEGHEGIIPARAGFTLLLTFPLIDHEDHPRSRGVYYDPHLYIQGGQGSSPLARGLRHAPDQDRGDCRIIPARAGFTWSRPPRSHSPRDHPRSRGVYCAIPTVIGSS